MASRLVIGVTVALLIAGIAYPVWIWFNPLSPDNFPLFLDLTVELTQPGTIVANATNGVSFSVRVTVEKKGVPEPVPGAVIEVEGPLAEEAEPKFTNHKGEAVVSAKVDFGTETYKTLTLTVTKDPDRDARRYIEAELTVVIEKASWPFGNQAEMG